MRQLYLFFLFLFFSSTIFAQHERSFGIGIGTNIVGIHNTGFNRANSDFSLPLSNPGLVLHLFHQTQTKRHFSLQYGFLLKTNTAGSKWREITLDSLSPPTILNYQVQFRSIELSIPLTLKCVLNPEKQRKLYLHASMQPTFVLSRHAYSVSKIDEKTSTGQLLLPRSFDYSSKNVAIGLGLGYDFKWFKRLPAFFQLGADYQLFNAKATGFFNWFPDNAHFYTVQLTTGVYIDQLKKK